MGMNGNSWGSQIANDLLNLNTNSDKLTTEERNNVIAVWELICGDNVSNIVSHAVVVASGVDSDGDSVTVTGTVTA